MKKLIFLILSAACFGQGFVLPTVDPYRFAAPRTYTTVFSDTFDRANADPMSSTSSSGGTWTVGPGDFENPKIVSNNVEGSAAPDSGASVSTPAVGADQSATITLVNLGSGFFAGPMVRMQSSTASGYLALVGAPANEVTFYKVTDTGTGDPTYDQLGATITVTTVVTGDTLTLEVSGTVLTAKVNGVAVGTRSDSTYSSGQPGFQITSSSYGISNFSAGEAD